jgi:SAM-dependent methyltransferase
MPSDVLDNPREQKFDRYFYNFAVPLVPKAEPGRDRLLDIGCGQGEICAIVSKLGWKPSGIDGHAANAERVRSMGFEGVAGDLNLPLPFPDRSFDFATMVEVVEHIVRAEDLIGEIARVLKPGGRLVMSTPNNAFYARRLRALVGREPDSEGYHFRFWIRRKLRRKFEEKGFRIVGRNSFGYYPLMNKLLFRKLRRLEKARVTVPAFLETLFAEHFCWLLENTKPA